MIKRTSDLSGEITEINVQFGLDGKEYEVDLTEAERDTFMDFLDTYTKAGRRVTGTKARTPRATSPQRDYDPKAVRAWAQEQGIEVSARGRVSADLVAQYKKAT